MFTKTTFDITSRQDSGDRLLRKRDGCFTLIALLISCDRYCSVALPYGAVNWSAVCVFCGISLSYSLTFRCYRDTYMLTSRLFVSTYLSYTN